MVTTYNTKDLVSFGKYLLSEKREERLNHTDQEVEGSPLPYEERMREVYDADLANWKSQQKVKGIMSVMNVICGESLDPETYEKWNDVVKELQSVRSDL